MKRSMRQLVWQWVLMGALLVLGGATSALAQNTYPWPASGAVGIGTTSPAYKLDVTGPDGAGAFTVAGTSSRMRVVPGAGYVTLEVTNAAQSVPQSLVLEASGGNVGIGTISPATKLHVVGDVRVDGNLAAKYQDVAEWVKTSSPMPPGTVVVVNSQEINQILPASQPYDTRVAGVVSAEPGLLLGEAGEGKVKVAQSGRVKVKVDATYGPITAGDLLVTSATPGHAMRSSPVKMGEIVIHRPGTLLGKALESLEEGQGEILVLLTLQ